MSYATDCSNMLMHHDENVIVYSILNTKEALKNQSFLHAKSNFKFSADRETKARMPNARIANGKDAFCHVTFIIAVIYFNTQSAH